MRQQTDVFTILKRLAALLLGVLLLGISIQFSAEGLNFNLKESMWFGYILALGVTVFELIFDEDGFNKSITVGVLGIFAYIYGIISNFYGIWIRQGAPSDTGSYLFAGVLAVFIEIAPEQLILWALNLSGRGVRDLLANLVNFGGDSLDGFKRGFGGNDVFTDRPKVDNEPHFQPPNQHGQGQGKKKKGGNWKPGMPGRPPKNHNQVPEGLEKLLKVKEVREE